MEDNSPLHGAPAVSPSPSFLDAAAFPSSVILNRVPSEPIPFVKNTVGMPDLGSDEHEPEVLAFHLFGGNNTTPPFFWLDHQGGETSSAAGEQEMPAMGTEGQALYSTGKHWTFEEPSGVRSTKTLVGKRKTMSETELEDLALVDAKRAKRIRSNRLSAARSKERKKAYIGYLEKEVQNLEMDTKTLAAQLAMVEKETDSLSALNNDLRFRVKSKEKLIHLQDDLTKALTKEVEHLKMAACKTSCRNDELFMNFGSSSIGVNQLNYQHSQAMRPVVDCLPAAAAPNPISAIGAVSVSQPSAAAGNRVMASWDGNIAWEEGYCLYRPMFL